MAAAYKTGDLVSALDRRTNTRTTGRIRDLVGEPPMLVKVEGIDVLLAVTDLMPAPTNAQGNSKSSSPSEVTNAEFIAAVFTELPVGAVVAVCSKAKDPRINTWPAWRADKKLDSIDLGNNNYVNTSSFKPPRGPFYARKSNLAAFHFLLLDDVGTKVSAERLRGFEVSWRLETSQGNFQGGIILDQPIDWQSANRLIKAVIAAKLCDAGTKGANRWARLPQGCNWKPQHLDSKTKQPFRCRLAEWHPERRYSVEQIAEQLGLELGAMVSTPEPRTAPPPGDMDTEATKARVHDYLVHEAEEAIQDSHGDDATYRVVERVKDIGLSLEACLEAMLDWWNPIKAHPPWPPDELREQGEMINGTNYLSWLKYSDSRELPDG